MEMREMSRLFTAGARKVSSTGEGTFGFGGNGTGYAGNRGQRHQGGQDDGAKGQSFGADGMTFTRPTRQPGADMRVTLG